MRVTNSIINVKDHPKFAADLAAVKVDGIMLLPTLLPAIKESAVLHCTALSGGLYTFDLSFANIPLGVVKILYEDDVLAITLEEK